jgi:hypothetical protein
MARSFSRVAGISAPIHDNDDSFEIRVREFQRGFVRGAAHANPEVKSAGTGEFTLGPQVIHLPSDYDVTKVL